MVVVFENIDFHGNLNMQIWNQCIYFIIGMLLWATLRTIETHRRIDMLQWNMTQLSYDDKVCTKINYVIISIQFICTVI